MNEVIWKMLERHAAVTSAQYKHALKEIIQELTLLAMARAKFFEHGAFYGGTAMRLFYGLERFSEDVDFTLIAPSPAFDLSPYCAAIRDELLSFGFTASVDKKEKGAGHAAVQSAFVKANTLTHLMTVGGLADPRAGTHRNEVLKVKIEVDTDPPPGAGCEVRYLQDPMPFAVKLYDQPSMFAGKMHAVLCRNLDTVRIKGRDLFDAVWYIGHAVPINVLHLENRLIQTGHLEPGRRLSAEDVCSRFRERIRAIDLEKAKQDVLPFLRDPFALEAWSPQFFDALAGKIVTARAAGR
jgi:hypothetical protein